MDSEERKERDWLPGMKKMDDSLDSPRFIQVSRPFLPIL
jgi:hypothetical protein